MKLKFINKITSAALLLALSVSTTSCVNDLNQSIKDPQTNTTFNQMTPIRFKVPSFIPQFIVHNDSFDLVLGRRFIVSRKYVL